MKYPPRKGIFTFFDNKTSLSEKNGINDQKIFLKIFCRYRFPTQKRLKPGILKSIKFTEAWYTGTKEIL